MQKYFDEPFAAGFTALFLGKTIVTVAGALLGIFVPLFLYTLFGKNIILVVAYYAVTALLYVVFVPFGARLLNTYGFQTALRVSVVVGAAHDALFIFMDKQNALFLLPLSALLILAYRVTYWIPYHVDFAKFTHRGSRGRELSLVSAAVLIATTAAPLLAGYIIVRYGFPALFLLAILLLLISGVPYFTIPPANERFSWSYAETWRRFFAHIKSRVLIAYMADGAENTVGLIVWPIFIFELLHGDYFEVGALTTMITGAAVAVQLAVGRYIDKKVTKESVLRWGSVLYAAGWVVKIFVATAFQIFIAGAYHSVAKIFTQTPVDTLTYEMSADEGHYIDEFTVLREIALNVGRVLMSALVIATAYFLPIQSVFIFSALAALALTLLRARDLDLLPPH